MFIFPSEEEKKTQQKTQQSNGHWSDNSFIVWDKI